MNSAVISSHFPICQQGAELGNLELPVSAEKVGPRSIHTVTRNAIVFTQRGKQYCGRPFFKLWCHDNDHSVCTSSPLSLILTLGCWSISLGNAYNLILGV